MWKRESPDKGWVHRELKDDEHWNYEVAKQVILDAKWAFDEVENEWRARPIGFNDDGDEIEYCVSANRWRYDASRKGDKWVRLALFAD